ncbi:hypothetical protein AB4120_14930 [Cupriavidus sp. 2KB_3]|uniref:hypothetical protein n=1 Tax=Cupriavidus sp. 2KB_3 TaxID=3232980 RepID=UPI003F92EA83
MTDTEFEAVMTCCDPKPECWCETCRPITMQDMRMVVCTDCGNKRCPKATDHRNACTDSNAVGQKGSSWEHVKPWTGAETGTSQASRARERRILAIDPGTTESGWCVLADGAVTLSGVMLNRELLRMLTMRQRNDPWGHVLAIEMIASYGMPVGHEVFETVRWIGRFQQAWHSPEAVKFVYRQDVKLHLCKTPRAKDANVRQALLDMFPRTGGGKTPQIGTKAQPGPLFGVSSHAWAALGVAVTAAHQISQQ